MRAITQDISRCSRIIVLAVCLLVIAGSRPAYASRKWEQSTSAELTVIADNQKSAEVIRILADEVHTLGELGLSPPLTRPVVFILTSDSAEIARAWPKNAPDPEGLGGLTYGYPDKIYVVVNRSKRNFHYGLRHELVHALLHEISLQIPLWLDEGLADNLSSFEVDGDKLSLGKIDARHRWRQGSCSPSASLSDVLGRDYRNAGYENGGGSTVHISDLTVRYLLDNQGLAKILHFLNLTATSSQKESLHSVFGLTPDQLNDEVLRYCRSGFNSKVVTLQPATPTLTIEATKPLDSNDVQSVFFEMLSRVQGRAAEVIDSYKKQLVSRPDDAMIARGLGIALVYDEKYSEALTYFGRIGHVFDADSTTVYHRLIACENEPSCKDAESGPLLSLLRTSRPDLATQIEDVDANSQGPNDEGALPGEVAPDANRQKSTEPSHKAELETGDTPESVAVWLIDGIRKSHEQWESRVPGFEDYPKDFNYTLNGKRISRESGMAFKRETVAKNTTLDQFEVTPVGQFPGQMIVTYRQQNTFYNQKHKGGEVFSIFVRDTYKYVNSQWKETKLEAVTAK